MGTRIIRYSTSERYAVLVFAFLGTIFDGADFGIFVQFMHPMATYFHTSLAVITIVQTLSYITGIVGGILFGYIADRFGRRMGLTLTVALYSLGTLATAFSPNYFWLLVFRIIAGLGIGGESGIAFAYLNEAWPSKRRGFANSLMQGMFIVGSFVSIVLFKVTSNNIGTSAWRYSFAYLGIVAVLAALIRLFMPESKMWLEFRDKRNSGEVVPRSSLGELFSHELRRTTIVMTIVVMFGFFGSYAVITYGPSMWLGIFNITPSKVAIIGYWASLVTFVSYVLFGAISDRIGRRKSFVWSATIGTAGYLFFGLLILLGHPMTTSQTVVGSTLFFAYLWMEFSYGYTGVQGVWMSEVFPTSVRATAENFSYYVGRGIGAGIGPLMALLVAQKLGGDARLAIAFGFVGTLGAAIFARLLPETKGMALKQTTGETEGVVAG